jgi:hypothetical protein
MKTRYRIPHVKTVEVPRHHVMRLMFDDGVVRELEFLAGGHEGTVFGPLDDPGFFSQVTVDPETERSCGQMGSTLILPCSTATSSPRWRLTSET